MSDVLVNWKQEYDDLKRGVIEYHQALGAYSAFKIRHKELSALTPDDLQKAQDLGESLAISTAVLEQLLTQDPQKLANTQAENAAKVLLEQSKKSN